MQDTSFNLCEKIKSEDHLVPDVFFGGGNSVINYYLKINDNFMTRVPDADLLNLTFIMMKLD